MFSLYQRTITSDNALVSSVIIVSSSYFNDNSTTFAKWKKSLLTQSSQDLFFSLFLFSFSLAAKWMYNCICSEIKIIQFTTSLKLKEILVSIGRNFIHNLLTS